MQSVLTLRLMASSFLVLATTLFALGLVRFEDIKVGAEAVRTQNLVNYRQNYFWLLSSYKRLRLISQPATLAGLVLMEYYRQISKDKSVNLLSRLLATYRLVKLVNDTSLKNFELHKLRFNCIKQVEKPSDDEHRKYLEQLIYS